MRYALLLLPSTNRVYGRSAPALALAELAIANEFAIGGRLDRRGTEMICGVAYVTFDADEPLTSTDLDVIANLSATYALFELGGTITDPVLTPLPLQRLERWEDDLLTIQRYGGKTNEQFTKLLVNLAVIVSHGAAAFAGAKVRVLDPLCGRGTTLNQAVMYGFDTWGIEREERDVDAYVQFFSTWLKDKRAKHEVDRERLRRGGRIAGARTTIRFAPTKQSESQQVVIVADDTRHAREHVRKVDAVVADLPYGVQHGSRTEEELSRRPAALLAAALPVWRSLLRPGGGVALAFNTRTLPRADALQAVVDAGLELIPTEDFAHTVDRSISRDVILARRPPTGAP